MHQHCFEIKAVRDVKIGAQLLAFLHSQGTLHKSLDAHQQVNTITKCLLRRKSKGKKIPKLTKQYCITFKALSMYHRRMNSPVVVPLSEGITASCIRVQMLWLQGNAECIHVNEFRDLAMSCLGFSSLRVQRHHSFYL